MSITLHEPDLFGLSRIDPCCQCLLCPSTGYDQTAHWAVTAVCGCVTLTCNPCIRRMRRLIVERGDEIGRATCRWCPVVHIGTYASCFRQIVPL